MHKEAVSILVESVKRRDAVSIEPFASFIGQNSLSQSGTSTTELSTAHKGVYVWHLHAKTKLHFLALSWCKSGIGSKQMKSSAQPGSQT
jgi:hypothetical protein